MGGLAPAVRWQARGPHLAGMAAALLLAVLVTRAAVTLPEWGRLSSGAALMTAEVTRLVVGLPVCVVGVLLLADRYARRRGALVLAAGVVWIVPPAMSDVLAAVERPGTPVAAAAILLAAAGTACQPLTVLLFPLCLLPRPAVRWPRTAVIVTAAAASIQYAVVWGLGTPGSARFASPWAGTAPATWAAGLLHDSQVALDWLAPVVTAAVTAELARAASKAGRGSAARWVIAAACPLYACLLLSDLWGESWTMVARSAGVVLWVAMIGLAASHGGLWRLERVTSHRMARAFVLAVLVIAVTCAAMAAWAALLTGRTTVTAVVAGCALVTGWAARPLVRHAVLAVERAFYGPRARPHEAVRALAVRLQQAPHPGDVPEQICRGVVEDLGLSGARIALETRAGARLLAAAGGPVDGPAQVFPLRHHGEVVGRLEVARDGASTPAERDSELLALLADQAGPALAALRFGEEAQAARERLVLAREEERRRLRREIHDGLGPQLAAVQLRLGVAQACGQASPAARAHLGTAAEVLVEALAEIRRITAGLAPATLVERGLLDATRILAHRLTTDAVRVTVTAGPLPAMAPAVETAAYRIAAEAVTNAVRHARARHVEVAFTTAPGTLTVTVTDDGTGFGADTIPGTGLLSVTERAEEVGGHADLHPTPTGTTITATLPTPPPPALPDHPGRPDRGHPPAPSSGIVVVPRTTPPPAVGS
ncbi:ATP-binding protein [Nonomuraea sp. NPDC049486]|uniref:ATP-binding protein n=1 Tax=Nonomuraea sp. NPDC049486 TaxID=3155773 RepID=UPI0034408647